MFLQISGGLECFTTAIVWAFVGFLSSVRACMTLQAIPCSKGLITAFNSTLKGLFSRVRSFVDLVKTQVSIWSKIAGSFRVHDPRESQVRRFEGQTFDKKLRVVYECMTVKDDPQPSFWPFKAPIIYWKKTEDPPPPISPPPQFELNNFWSLRSSLQLAWSL